VTNAGSTGRVGRRRCRGERTDDSPSDAMARSLSSFEARIALPTLMAPVRMPLALYDCRQSELMLSMLHLGLMPWGSQTRTSDATATCVHQHTHIRASDEPLGRFLLMSNCRPRWPQSELPGYTAAANQCTMFTAIARACHEPM